MRGEGISTPRARHKGWQPLIECAQCDFKIVYFSFLYFFLFLWSTRVFPFAPTYSSIAMRKSDLRSSILSSDSFLLKR